MNTVVALIGVLIGAKFLIDLVATAFGPKRH
jgi:hypothetical protein